LRIVENLQVISPLLSGSTKLRKRFIELLSLRHQEFIKRCKALKCLSCGLSRQERLQDT